MDNRRKIGVGVCSVALGFEVVSLVALIVGIWEFLPVQMIIIGLCIAMIVVQVMGITARAHLIMSIIALIVAVIQVIAFAVVLAIDIDNNAELNTEDAGVNQAFYYYICVPICLLFVVVTVPLCINVKLASVMNKDGASQQVVYVSG